MVTYTCSDCGFKTTKKSNFDRHSSKQFSCNEAPHKCKKCTRPFYSQTALYRHQKQCTGPEQSIEEKDQQIESLKNALAASSGLNHEIKAKQQKIINNNQTNNITINDVKNITQNIVILPSGSESIEHLKKFPMDELKEKIHMDRDPRTHIEAFKLIRLDPEHPENHNMLLTDRNSNKVLFIADEHGWQEGDYTFQVRNAIFETNKSLQNLIPFKEREGSEYYWNHLVRGIGGACNERNDAMLKPIFEGIRDPLHQATLRLMNIQPEDESSRDISPNRNKQPGDDGQIALLIEQEKTKRDRERTEREKEMTLREIERTKQLQLELELAKVRQSSVHQSLS